MRFLLGIASGAVGAAIVHSLAASLPRVLIEEAERPARWRCLCGQGHAWDLVVCPHRERLFSLIMSHWIAQDVNVPPWAVDEIHAGLLRRRARS